MLFKNAAITIVLASTALGLASAQCLKAAVLAPSFTGFETQTAIITVNGGDCGPRVCNFGVESFQSTHTNDEASFIASVATADIAIIMNNQDDLPVTAATKAAVESVGKLMVFDRFAGGDGGGDVNVPGLVAGDVVQDRLATQDPISPPGGPGGVIGSVTAGVTGTYAFAAHGHIVSGASVMMDAEEHWSQTTAGGVETTTIQYCLDDKLVYYSTMAMAPLLNQGQSPFEDIFANAFCNALTTRCGSDSPTTAPSAAPSATPTAAPSATPTAVLSATPTATPSAIPSAAPTAAPSATPSAAPTDAPSATPSVTPSATPSAAPTDAPSAAPSATPTAAPTDAPTSSPTAAPTMRGTAPTSSPSIAPSTEPTESPAPSPFEPDCVRIFGACMQDEDCCRGSCNSRGRCRLLGIF